MTKEIVLRLTKAQAEALLVLAGEGAEGILTDQSNINSFLNGSPVAANNALKKLQQAIKDADV